MGAAASVVMDELDPSLREQVEKVQADGGDFCTLKKTALEWASTRKDTNAVGRVEKWCLEAGIQVVSLESRHENQQTVDANIVEYDVKKAHETSGSKKPNSSKLQNCTQERIKRFWIATIHSRDELSEKEFVRLHVRIQTAMSANIQESDAVAVSENLYKIIVGSSPGKGCCFNTFSKAMLAIATDFLGHQAGVEAYHHFLGLLLSHITVGVSRSLVQSLWEVASCEELLDAAKLKASVPSLLPESSKREMTWDPTYVGMMSTSKEMLRNYSFSSDKSGGCEAVRTEHRKGMISVIRAMEGFPSNKVSHVQLRIGVKSGSNLQPGDLTGDLDLGVTTVTTDTRRSRLGQDVPVCRTEFALSNSNMIRQEIKDHCRRYTFRVGDVVTITMDTRARTEAEGTVPTFGDGRLQFAVNGVTIVEFAPPLTKPKRKKKKKKLKGKKKGSKSKKVNNTSGLVSKPTFYDFHLVAAIRDAHTFISVLT